ncbi:MAG: hypothetical protein AAFO69_11750 [Bacteroidota bacterium]
MKHFFTTLCIVWIISSPLMAQDSPGFGLSIGFQTTEITTTSELTTGDSYQMAVGTFLGGFYQFPIGKNYVITSLSIEQRRIKFKNDIQLTDVQGIPQGLLEPRSAVAHYNFSLSGLYMIQKGNWRFGTGIQIRHQMDPIVRFEEVTLPFADRFKIKSLNPFYLDIPLEVSYHLANMSVFLRLERSITNRLAAPNGIKEFDNTIKIGVSYFF